MHVLDSRAVAAVSADSPLDPGIQQAVMALLAAGVDTFESCEGGPGHAFPEPTVRFQGGVAEGPRAFAVALKAGLPVIDLRRVWPVIDGELTGPWWELTFVTTTGKQCDSSLAVSNQQR